MCGITALVSLDPEAGSDLAPALARMTRSLAHRGPDDEGYLFWDGSDRLSCAGGPATPPAAYASTLPFAPGGPLSELDRRPARVGLGHRRLAVLDPGIGGHQPQTYGGADGQRYLLSYNGEIYNYRELREELSALGHSFRTASDTEVLLAAYAQWGRECLGRFVGMWAFLLVDTERRELLASRDPFGIKPLYYTSWCGALAFASEIRALRELPGLRLRPDPQPFHDYLRHGWSDFGNRTLFTGIHQMPAGTMLAGPLDEVAHLEPEVYESAPPPSSLGLSFDQAAERLRQIFLDSIDLHLRSDVRVGAALSGGIDSSAIVCAIRHLRPEMDLHTISYVADDASLSEEHWAELVTQATDARCHRVRVSGEELAQDLDDLILAQDLPVLSTSMYAQYRVFRRAREEGITVMLDGQGADELLAGYVADFLPARIAGLLRRGRLLTAGKLLSALRRQPGIAASTLLARTAGDFVPRALEPAARRVSGREGAPDWLDLEWFSSRGVEPRRMPRWGKAGLRGALRRTRTTTHLPVLLRYEDRNSMAWSIESRVPFLTSDLAGFLAGLPEEFLLDDGGTSKSILRRAMRGIVPQPILDRRDKIGFVTPEREWLRLLEPWVDRVVRSDTCRRLPGLDQAPLLAEWEAMRSGARPLDARVWRWMNVIRWAELVGLEVDA